MEPRQPEQRWWKSPLPVERLAWASVLAARKAAQRLADQRGQDLTVGTSPELVAASFAALEHLRVDGRQPVGFAPLSGFFRASDGWVRLHANYPHHAAAVARALAARTEDRDGVAAAVAARTAEDVEQSVTAERGIAVAVRTEEEWATHPHGRATAGLPWATVRPEAQRPVLTGGRLPLDEVRVLDLTRVIAGPTCSQLLGCLGADVLRIDPPHRPELLDQYLSNGMGKRSATVDLEDASDDLEQLLATADVVLLGYRPGSLSRFGLDPDDLLQRHPHLVIASLSAWGEQGPWAQRPGFDSIVQATSGIAMLCADPSAPDGRPGALPVQALDHATGHLLAAHVMELLADDRGGVVRASLLGAARTLLRDSPPPDTAPVPLPVPLVDLDSPHGTLRAVPPPLTVDGATIERSVTAYGVAETTWHT